MGLPHLTKGPDPSITEYLEVPTYGFSSLVNFFFFILGRAVD